MKLYLYLLED